jgi:DNA primase
MSRQDRHHLHYTGFADAIDIDAFEEAIKFDPLEHKNGEDIGYCPDLWGMHKHGDTTGKFAINRDKRVYHCWLCGGGSLLSLAMSFLGADEETATEWIHQFAVGDIRTETQFADDMFKLLDDYEERTGERMPYFNAHVLSQFHGEGEHDQELYEWCEARGISDEVAVEHQLGYGPNHKKLAPMRGGEKIDDDYFGPCIVFPHFWESKLVGWQHRWLNHGLDTPKWLPKYTNTSDFPKARTIYNYDHAMKHPGKRGVIVVESVPTVLFLESMGLPAIATFGSGVKEAQLRMMRWFEDGVVIAPDNDAPGEKFAKQTTEYLERFIPVTVLKPVTLSEGADLGDYIDTDDPVGNLYDHLEQSIQDDVFD